MNGINLSVCPCVCMSVRVSFCAKSTSFCQSAGRSTESHLVTTSCFQREDKVFPFPWHFHLHHHRCVKTLTSYISVLTKDISFKIRQIHYQNENPYNNEK